MTLAMPQKTLEHCRQLDAQDPLRDLRHQFDLPPGVIYLDGNSLGVLPKTTAARVAEVVTQEWGQGLIRSWNSAGWFDAPRRAGDKIARLVGAGPNEVVATDSTSINLFKVLSAALNMAREDAPQRKTLVSERSNFPTDLYIAEALCRECGCTLKLVEPEEIADSLTEPDVAVLMLTHVNYRTGAMHDMAARHPAAAHAAGILAVWDLAHSAGAVPVDLTRRRRISPWVAATNTSMAAPARRPLCGFIPAMPTASGNRWRAGGATPPHLPSTPSTSRPPASRATCAAPSPSSAWRHWNAGSIPCWRPSRSAAWRPCAQSRWRLTDLFIGLVETRCAGHGLTLATPRDHGQRGSQVCLARATGAYAIVQALIARGVIGDFRAGDGGLHPDILRFGFTPLYIGFEDVWNAVEHLRQVLDTREWQQPEFNQKHAVT
jgi:kynureninase